MKKKGVDSIIDGHKIHLHPDKSAGWMNLNDCYPIHVEIGVTNSCDQNCVFCALYFAIGKEDIDKEVMLRALKDMANPKIKYKITFEYGDKSFIYYDKVNSVMFGGEGEPTLHKDLGLFVQKAKEYGLDVALTTNGIAFNKKLQEQCLPYLSWVKFSIDAGISENYAKIHRAPEKHFEMLLRNISDSAKLKREKELEVTIGTQFLMVPETTNKNEVLKLVGLLKEIAPDYLAVKPYSDHPRSKKDFIVNPEIYNDLEKTIEDLRQNCDFKIYFRRETIERIEQGNIYPRCYALPFISLIDSKGNILPCNIFYGIDEFIYGNIYENSFSEIWGGDRRKEVLNRLKEKGLEKCRAGCRCDGGNRYLHRLKNPDLHDNFT